MNKLVRNGLVAFLSGSVAERSRKQTVTLLAFAAVFVGSPPARADYTFVKSFGTYGSGPGQFNAPTDVAVDPSGNIWAPDVRNQRVEEFTSSGTFIRQFGSLGFGVGNGQFLWPSGLAADQSGNIWVSDAGDNDVQELRCSAAMARTFPSLAVTAVRQGSSIGPRA